MKYSSDDANCYFVPELVNNTRQIIFIIYYIITTEIKKKKPEMLNMSGYSCIGSFKVNNKVEIPIRTVLFNSI